jgi:hypothetical protein
MKWNGTKQRFHSIAWIFFDIMRLIFHSIVWKVDEMELVITFYSNFDLYLKKKSIC